MNMLCQQPGLLGRVTSRRPSRRARVFVSGRILDEPLIAPTRTKMRHYVGGHIQILCRFVGLRHKTLSSARVAPHGDARGAPHGR